MGRPTDDDLALVGQAVEVLGRPVASRSRAAAAVRTSSGSVFQGFALGGACAEPVAVVAALAAGQRVTALAVVARGAGTRVVTPCASCRALLTAYAPGVSVLHVAGGLRVAPVAELPG